MRPQLDLAIRFVRGSHQCRVGDSELQMRYGHESDPLSFVTIAQCQVRGRIVELFQCGTLRAPLDGAGPQHHRECLIMPYPMTRLCGRIWGKKFDFHSFAPFSWEIA